jgi:hypothetical protein
MQKISKARSRYSNAAEYQNLLLAAGEMTNGPPCTAAGVRQLTPAPAYLAAEIRNQVDPAQ